jgi:hypothetical protein
MGRKFLLSLGLLAVILTFSVYAFPSKPARSGLQVLTNDQPSSVFLDNEYLDKSPLIENSLQPGIYRLRIEPDDPELASYETNITLRPGVLSAIVWRSGIRPEFSGGVLFEMEPIASKKKAEMSVISIPDSAIISLDDGERSQAPLLYTDLEPGNYNFRAFLPSYEAQDHTITIVPGYRLIIYVKLARSDDEAEAGRTRPSPSPSAAPETEADSDLAANTTDTATNSANLAEKPYVKIGKTNFLQDGKEVLRVRRDPAATGAVLGYAEVGKSFPYLNLTENGWHKIRFENADGWVSGEFSEVIR